MKNHPWTLRCNLENEIGHRIYVEHPLVAWMAKHAAAALIWWCAEGHDGRKAYQRVRGTEFRPRLLAFGEACRFRNRGHELLRQKVPRGHLHRHRQADGPVHAPRWLRREADQDNLKMPGAEKLEKVALVKVGCTPYDLRSPAKKARGPLSRKDGGEGG